MVAHQSSHEGIYACALAGGIQVSAALPRGDGWLWSLTLAAKSLLITDTARRHCHSCQPRALSPRSQVYLFPRKAIDRPPYAVKVGSGARSATSFASALTGVLAVANPDDFMSLEGTELWQTLRKDVALPSKEFSRVRNACRLSTAAPR